MTRMFYRYVLQTLVMFFFCFVVFIAEPRRSSVSFFSVEDYVTMPRNRATSSPHRPTTLLLQKENINEANPYQAPLSLNTFSSTNSSFSYSSLPCRRSYKAAVVRENDQSSHADAATATPGTPTLSGDGEKSGDSSDESLGRSKTRPSVQRHFSDRALVRRQAAFDDGDQTPARVSNNKRGTFRKRYVCRILHRRVFTERTWSVRVFTWLCWQNRSLSKQEWTLL